MPESIFSVAIPAATEARMFKHLIRADREEDLLFALWYPSRGNARHTALIHAPVFPESGDRQRHGNASFNQQLLGTGMRAGNTEQSRCRLYAQPSSSRMAGNER